MSLPLEVIRSFVHTGTCGGIIHLDHLNVLNELIRQNMIGDHLACTIANALINLFSRADLIMFEVVNKTIPKFEKDIPLRDYLYRTLPVSSDQARFFAEQLLSDVCDCVEEHENTNTARELLATKEEIQEMSMPLFANWHPHVVQYADFGMLKKFLGVTPVESGATPLREWQRCFNQNECLHETIALFKSSWTYQKPC